MNWRATKLAVDRRGVTPNQKLVLLLLCYHQRDDDSGSWPSVALLADESGLHPSTVRKTVRELVALQLLTTRLRYDQSGKRSSSHYLVTLDSTTLATDAKVVVEDAPDYRANDSHYRANDSHYRANSSHYRAIGSSGRDPIYDSDQKIRERTKIRSDHEIIRSLGHARATRARSATLRAALDSDFALVWSAYPRKEGKQAARKVFMRLKASKELLARIVADVSRRYAQVERRFVPHPSTYLNQRRWEDEHLPPASAAGAQQTGVDLAKQMLAEAMEDE